MAFDMLYFADLVCNAMNPWIDHGSHESQLANFFPHADFRPDVCLPRNGPIKDFCVKWLSGNLLLP